MRLPSSCLHFGPTQNPFSTLGTSHEDQADKVTELKLWVKQQVETLGTMCGEEVELSPSPLLLEEMEECFGEADWADVDFEPGRNRYSPAQSSSKQRRSRRKCCTSAAAPAELPPSPPAAAEFPGGFLSCPGRRHHRWAVATEKVQVGPLTILWRVHPP
ncbi:hypothetical protein AMECASPLE_039123 [Ameca splendens]|uniref:Uncharacterized protein n=1 Tax=Ameca splendens TaxID=208324 RepID=A0ABV1A5C6_9TELE